MNEIIKLEIINEQEILGKDFKVYGSVNKPLFLARDVAAWLDYNLDKVNEMISIVDEYEKLTETISWSGQRRKMGFLCLGIFRIRDI